ncbi:hypothetical protein SAMD00023353_4800750 [Rosellinia necatrix]|uniref:Rhodopsin domain-containing protein n=1 Tax=Rosellinia necatrix TaxID=77044 RepID=A0A1W2TQA5_ROSNE|nr:hypothetical protein SAMD00023353_4800750 [Rosellinia necatrix]
MGTFDNESNAVGIATWFLASAFLVVYLSGQSAKFAILGQFKSDDGFLLLGVTSTLALSIAYSVAASNGLGKGNLTESQVIIIQKAYYAADILYVVSLCFVKLSLLMFIRQIVIDSKQIWFILSLIGFQILLGVVSVFAVAFQCVTPYTWNTLSQQCFNQPRFWIAFGVFDILTDILVILVSILIVWNLRLAVPHKLVVIGCFAPRLLVTVAAIVRLAFLVPIRPDDFWAWKSWAPVVITELQLCLSIVTACIPSIKPLFEAIEAGVWHADDLRRRGLSLEDLHSRGYLKLSKSPMMLHEKDSGVMVVAGPQPESHGIQ